MKDMNAMNNRRNNIFTIVLLSVYGLILFWIVLLKASTVAELPYLPCERTLNLVPFHYDVEVGTHFEEVVLNALVFMPFGLYLVMLGMKAWKAILLGFCLSLLFEALQYVLSIGAADVTDIIMNTLGTAIGTGLYLLLRRMCRNAERMNAVLNVVMGIGTALFLLAAAVLLIANA